MLQQAQMRRLHWRRQVRRRDARSREAMFARGLTPAISGGAQSARRLLIANHPRRNSPLQAACRRATTAASHS
jgi:hypothetical protein